MCSMILRLLWFNVIHLSLVMMNQYSSRCSTKLPTSPRLSLWHLYTWTASEVEPSGPTSHIAQETKVDLNSKNEDYLYMIISPYFVSLNIRKPSRIFEIYPWVYLLIQIPLWSRLRANIMAFEPWCNVDMLYTTDKTDADWDKKKILAAWLGEPTWLEKKYIKIL